MTVEHPLSLFEADSLEAAFLLAKVAQPASAPGNCPSVKFVDLLTNDASAPHAFAEIRSYAAVSPPTILSLYCSSRKCYQPQETRDHSSV